MVLGYDFLWVARGLSLLLGLWLGLGASCARSREWGWVRTSLGLLVIFAACGVPSSLWLGGSFCLVFNTGVGQVTRPRKINPTERLGTSGCSILAAQLPLPLPLPLHLPPLARPGSRARSRGPWGALGSGAGL